MDEDKPYTWRKITGTEWFRAVCDEHGDMAWRLVNHKDYPDTVIGVRKGLPTQVKGQIMQIWKCTGDGCTVQTVC